MALTVDSFKMIVDDFIPGLRRIEDVLAIIGILFAGKISLTLLCDLSVGIRAHFWSRLWNKHLIKRYGQWAVVTGCTDGIGLGYAHELAKNGLNIVLLSRTMEKLQRVATELRTKYNVETYIIQVDFAVGESLYENIEAQLKGREIGILVNNVGVMLPYPKYFVEVTSKEIWSHVNVNMGAVTAMTKIILPGMIERGKGAIINIASIAGTGPIPLLGIYAASKAYVDYYSQALESEHAGNGITIQTINPSYVCTNMTSFSKLISTPTFLTPTAPTFAASALNTLGYTKRTTGYWSHGIQKWIVDNLCPTWLFIVFTKLTHKILLRDVKNHTS